VQRSTLILACILVWQVAGMKGWSSLVKISFGESGLNEVIPDNSPVGMFRSLRVSGYSSQAPYELSVDLTIQGTGYGAMNGNYYSYLRHTSSNGTVSQLAVLLNRVGMSAGSATGYTDNGMSVTLEDRGIADIHNYRLHLSGNQNNPVVGMLTGTWQADGRNIDPYGVSDSSLRTTTLDGLGAGDPNGTWTLFLADLQAGGTGNLTDWQVRLTPTPEPSVQACFGLGALGWVILKRRSSKKSCHR
jgi:hypothetical protein